MLRLLEVLEVMRCVLLFMLEAAEGRLYCWRRCGVLLVFMLEAAEGRLCLPEVLEVSEVMRCVLLYAGDCGGLSVPSLTLAGSPQDELEV